MGSARAKVAAVALAGAILAARCARDAPQERTAAQFPAPATASIKASISYQDAKPVLDAFRGKLPGDLTARTAGELEALWPGWVLRHDAAIRARLDPGDVDSIINLWLFGSTFTTRPRATNRDLARLGGRASAEDLLLGRLDDLVAGLASPGANERLKFARDVIVRHGIDPETAAGQDAARHYLVDARARVIAENERYRRAARSAGDLPDEAARLSAYATVYRDRGLSSDTSLPVDFALDQTLAAAKSKGRLGAGDVRRVAIIGPGLDFADKADGYDFYPQQTIQPFALIDSMIRLGLAAPGDLRVTTFDLSQRVNQHIDAARERAQQGEAYVLQLPLDTDDPSHQWNRELVAYWQRFGDRIGDEANALAAPPGAGAVRIRAVRVRPAVVTSITAHDLNIVLEHLAPLPAGERFDVIIATNVLVYYDAFEQSLALANVAMMLRPGGYFLTNYAVSPAAPIESQASLISKVYWDRQQNGDTLFWYQRR
jgi:hypothetical protein